MIVYLIKGIACSFVLWAFHYYFLEKERMHVFNRFYLLIAPVASFLIPFLPLRQAAGGVTPVAPAAAGANETTLLRWVQVSVEGGSSLSDAVFWWWLPGIYLAGVLFLTFRFRLNMVRIRRMIRTAKQYPTPEATIAALPRPTEICTFMHYVICDEHQYRNGLIPAQVWQHEFTHVRQRHTWDILFMEFLGIVYWFNPVVALYKRSVRLNHEFLADQPVTDRPATIAAYQRLLVARLSGGAASSLVSSFNYSQTKKRLIMMTQKTNHNRMLLKGTCLSLMAAGLLYAVSDEVRAQEAPAYGTIESKYTRKEPPAPPFEMRELPVVPPPPPPVESEPSGPGATEEELADYNASFEKHKVRKVNAKGQTYSEFTFPEAEKERLLLISKRMSPEQLRQRRFTIMKMPVPQKSPPSPELFESFKKADLYGVWLNGKKVDNEVLNGYVNSDIADYSISKLYGAAKKGRGYTHQLDLETNAHFDAHFDRRMANRFITGERVRLDPKK